MYKAIYNNKNNGTVSVLDDSDDKWHQYPITDFRYAYRKSSTGTFTSLFGDKLERITTYDDNDPTLFESDLNPEMKILLDLYPNNEEISKGHRILIYDIETSTEGGFPDIMAGDKAITAIAAYDYSDDKYYSLILDPDKKVKNKTIGNEITKSFDTETALLTYFIKLWADINPTIISGWNINFFDNPYLYNRSKNVLGKTAVYKLSPIGQVYQNLYSKKMIIGGVSSLDYIDLYKKFIGTMKSSYSLANVAKDEELKHQKLTYKGNLDTLYKTDIDRFVEYNLVDVKVVVELNEKYDFINLAQAVCHKGHIPYERFQLSSWFIDGAILDYLHTKLNVIAPNRPEDGRENYEEMLKSDEEGFIGAYVKIPEPSIYSWVCSADIQSLYPSVIMSLNISPEKKIGKIENWDYHKFKSGEMKEVKINDLIYDADEFKQMISNNTVSISSSGVCYKLKNIGVIPDILDKWFEERIEYRKSAKQYNKEGNKEKEAFYNRRQLRQKIFLNCFSPDTKVMTKNGVKYITDVKIGDLVYSLNKETGNSELKPVTRTYEYDYDGDMVHFNSHHIDFMVTPNHKFWVSKLGKKKYKNFSWEDAGNIINDKVRRKFPPIKPLPTYDNPRGAWDDIDLAYRIQINKLKGKGPTLKSAHRKLLPYKGKVYCVEVQDNHTLLCGRNDKYQWCGQSVYGTLGLPIFRFYDKDNAEAVTVTGQTIIKSAENLVNDFFNSKLKNANKAEWIGDHVIAIDTDSNYFSFEKLMIINNIQEDKKINYCIETVTSITDKINKLYSYMVPAMFNIPIERNRIKIVPDVIASRAIWTGKKRYAMIKVFDMEKMVPVYDKYGNVGALKVVGIDTVRSSFPKSFRILLGKVLEDILRGKDLNIIDEYIMDFEETIKSQNPADVSKTSSIKFISQKGDKNYNCKGRGIFEIIKGSPITAKAGNNHNDLIKLWKLQKQFDLIRHGDKAKWIYLLPNPYAINVIAFRGDDTDPDKLLEFINEYGDKHRMFEAELKTKILGIYSAAKRPFPNRGSLKAMKVFDFNETW